MYYFKKYFTRQQITIFQLKQNASEPVSAISCDCDDKYFIIEECNILSTRKMFDTNSWQNPIIVKFSALMSTKIVYTLIRGMYRRN